jgi:Arc/MetJ-type ribon-helix-helix transcriptional regulator
MTTISVSLSASDLEFVNQQVASGHFSSPDEYLQSLIHAEQALQRRRPGPTRADDEFWKRLKAQAGELARARSQS